MNAISFEVLLLFTCIYWQCSNVVDSDKTQIFVRQQYIFPLLISWHVSNAPLFQEIALPQEYSSHQSVSVIHAEGRPILPQRELVGTGSGPEEGHWICWWQSGLQRWTGRSHKLFHKILHFLHSEFLFPKVKSLYISPLRLPVEITAAKWFWYHGLQTWTGRSHKWFHKLPH